MCHWGGGDPGTCNTFMFSESYNIKLQSYKSVKMLKLQAVLYYYDQLSHISVLKHNIIQLVTRQCLASHCWNYTMPHYSSIKLWIVFHQATLPMPPAGLHLAKLITVSQLASPTVSYFGRHNKAISMYSDWWWLHCHQTPVMMLGLSLWWTGHPP
jgi:hypothetical protein